MKTLILLLTISFINVYGQAETRHLNTTIFIDDHIVQGSTISEATFLIQTEDSVEKIEFEYIIGEIILGQEAFRKLNSFDQNSVLEIYFKYRKGIDDFFERDYSIKTHIYWINKSYSILKIYNFDNMKNRKCFLKEEG